MKKEQQTQDQPLRETEVSGSLSPKTHYVKCVNPFFGAVWDEIKRFEYRLNDRDYEVNDIVYLQEFSPENQFFSGAEIKILITYLLKDFPGLEPNHCVFAFNILEKVIMNEDLAGSV